VRERLDARQIRQLMETGRGQMPSFASFSELEKRAVIAFLLGEGKDEQIETKDLELELC
jgi:hypothetical protein